MFGFLDETKFDAQLDIAHAERSRTHAGRGEGGIVGRKDGRGGNNDVEVHVGKSSPIELERGAERVGFHGRTVRCCERVELIVSEVNGFGVVRLEGRAGEGGGGEGKQESEGAEGVHKTVICTHYTCESILSWEGVPDGR